MPAEQFAMLCDQALEAGGRLMGVFRELAVEREVRRREVAVERWRERFRVVQGSDRLVDALVAWGDVEAVSVDFHVADWAQPARLGAAGDGWPATSVTWWNQRAAVDHVRSGLVANGLLMPSDQVVIVA